MAYPNPDSVQIPVTDLSVFPICLGTPLFGTGLTGAALDELFDRFIASGGNFFDTAHCYAFWREEPGAIGASERTLGRLIRTRGLEKSVVVATKGGHPSASPLYLRPDDFLSPAVLANDVRDSLDRLGLPQLDLFLLHRDDPRVPVDEIMDALAGLATRGLIRYAGASNWTSKRIAAANDCAHRLGLPAFVISSPAWNLAHRSTDASPDPTMRELTAEDEAWHRESLLPVMCYNSSAGGWFASGGKSGFCDNPVSRARLARCEELGRALGASGGQVALAWLMAQPFPVFPIIGTTNPLHLTEFLGSTALHLTAEQARWLRDGPSGRD